MKLQVAGQDLSFALTGKNTLTVTNGRGGEWEIRLEKSAATNGLLNLGPRLKPSSGDRYNYPARTFAQEIRRHFSSNESIIGTDLRSFLDRYSPLDTRQVA